MRVIKFCEGRTKFFILLLEVFGLCWVQMVHFFLGGKTEIAGGVGIGNVKVLLSKREDNAKAKILTSLSQIP